MVACDVLWQCNCRVWGLGCYQKISNREFRRRDSCDNREYGVAIAECAIREGRVSWMGYMWTISSEISLKRERLLRIAGNFFPLYGVPLESVEWSERYSSMTKARWSVRVRRRGTLRWTECAIFTEDWVGWILQIFRSALYERSMRRTERVSWQSAVRVACVDVTPSVTGVR